MSRGIAAAALVVCVLVAGCGGPFAEGEPTDETTGDATADGEQVIAAPPGTAENATAEAATAETATRETEAGGTEATGTETGGTGAAETATARATATGTTEPTATGPTTAEPAELTTRRTSATATPATFDRDVGYEIRVSNAGPTARNVTVRIAAANDSAVAFAESIPLGPNESSTFGVDFPHVGEYEAEVSVGDETATRRWEVAERNPDEALSVHVSESGNVYLGFVSI